MIANRWTQISPSPILLIISASLQMFAQFPTPTPSLYGQRSYCLAVFLASWILCSPSLLKGVLSHPSLLS
jgi:hypothetical protein